MQLYPNVLICIIASISSTFITISTVTAIPDDQTSKPMIEMKQHYRHLRTSQKEGRVLARASTTTSLEEKTTQQQLTSRQLQDVYEVDSETGSIYINGEKFDIKDDPDASVFDDDFFAEACNGFKFEVDENGFCKVSTGYIVLMVFINIAIIAGIVIASCACCKCCVWYPYLCCATDAERQVHQCGSGSTRKAAYPDLQKNQPFNVQTMEVKQVTKEAFNSETLRTGTIDNTASNINDELEC